MEKVEKAKIKVTLRVVNKTKKNLGIVCWKGHIPFEDGNIFEVEITNAPTLWSRARVWLLGEKELPKMKTIGHPLFGEKLTRLKTSV